MKEKGSDRCLLCIEQTGDNKKSCTNIGRGRRWSFIFPEGILLNTQDPFKSTGITGKIRGPFDVTGEIKDCETYQKYLLEAQRPNITTEGQSVSVEEFA